MCVVPWPVRRLCAAQRDERARGRGSGMAFRLHIQQQRYVMTQRIRFEHILCPTDFSETSRLALDQAIAVARWFDAELTAVHVSPVVPLAAPEPLVTVAMASSSPATWRQMQSDLEEFLEPARRAGLRTRAVLLEGESVNQILDLAWATSTDLIVMGTLGRSGLERWLLGSVAESVLRRARCPVMTVSHAGAHAESVAENAMRRILCPVDLCAASHETLQFGLSLAQERNAVLTVLHVVEAPDQDLGVNAHFDVPEYRAWMVTDAKERLRRAVPAVARNWCDVTELVTVGEPSREILRVAKEQGCDAIVMGARGPNPIDALFFGSTARRVVRDAACPVLTLPLEGRRRAYVHPRSEATVAR
jgi:nucleotide-binding universal stress UspA family protein